MKWVFGASVVLLVLGCLSYVAAVCGLLSYAVVGSARLSASCADLGGVWSPRSGLCFKREALLP